MHSIRIFAKNMGDPSLIINSCYYEPTIVVHDIFCSPLQYHQLPDETLEQDLPRNIVIGVKFLPGE